MVARVRLFRTFAWENFKINDIGKKKEAVTAAE